MNIVELEQRFDRMLAERDLTGLSTLDEELRAQLAETVLSEDQLKRLDILYGRIVASVTQLRDESAQQAKGMHSNRKGINAYKSS